MKKILLLAATAAIAMTSCSKNEDVAVAPSRSISFQDSYVTKANLSAGTFNIAAYTGTVAAPTTPVYSSSKFIDVYNVANNKYGGSDKMYYYDATVNYWFYTYGNLKGSGNAPLAADALKAFAVNCADTVVYSVASGTTPQIVFTAPANAAVDLVTASLANQTPAADKQLTFAHQLTKVRFSVKTSSVSNESPIKVTSIEYAVNKNSTTINLLTGAQTLGADNNTVYTMPAPTTNNALTSSFVAFESDANACFYVVPQTLTTSAPLAPVVGTDAYLKVTYQVGNNGSFTGVDDQVKYFSLQGAALGKNQQIHYKITLGLQAITFVADVTDWTTPEVEPAGF